jgi:hypothetical protein
MLLFRKDTFQLESNDLSLAKLGQSSSIARKKVLTWVLVLTVFSLTVPHIISLNFFDPFLKLLKKSEIFDSPVPTL